MLKKLFTLLLIVIIVLIGNKNVVAKNINSVGIIPKPVIIENLRGEFTLSKNSRLIIVSGAEGVDHATSALSFYLKEHYNFNNLPILESKKPKFGDILFELDTLLDLPKEGYLLEVKDGKIHIKGSTSAGLFYGVQTLIQLLPKDYSNNKRLKISNTRITDYPRFKWRGLHLDVCRHFFPKEFVFKYLDYMALHKLNVFHFHLTDDQGWRIEIKRYPDLTKVGSQRAETIIGKSKLYNGKSQGGYYTQEDIKEIVKYAANLFITVVPEIEMPGHAQAALASYPELGCKEKEYKVLTKWGISEEVFCAGKESTFEFLENVLSEVIELFPGKFIHIGGDECPKNSWKECPECQKRIAGEGLKNEEELQSYFVHRIELFVNSKGRSIIGWDEILEGGLAPNAAVMSWRGEEGGISAAKQNHFVVMSPVSHCYFDYYQADPKTEPLAIGGFTNLEKVYSFEPVPRSLSKIESNYIMGAQGNLWTEYIDNEKHVEYMVYPRAAALSEVLWSKKEAKNYEDFIKRLQYLKTIYDLFGLNYCKDFEK